jgi:hypothetical protein
MTYDPKQPREDDGKWQPKGDHIEHVKTAFQKHSGTLGLPGYARVEDVRNDSPKLSRNEFDEVVKHLRKLGHVGLSLMEGRRKPPQSEIDNAFHDDDGQVYSLMQSKGGWGMDGTNSRKYSRFDEGGNEMNARVALVKARYAAPHWVTLEPSGTHVELDGDGNVTKGPDIHRSHIKVPPKPAWFAGKKAQPPKQDDEAQLSAALDHVRGNQGISHEQRRAAAEAIKGKLADIASKKPSDKNAVANAMARSMASKIPSKLPDRPSKPTPEVAPADAKSQKLVSDFHEIVKQNLGLELKQELANAARRTDDGEGKPQFSSADARSRIMRAMGLREDYARKDPERKHGGWITLHPHGDDGEGYVHVMIDGGGKILAGPKGMEGKNVAHLSDTHHASDVRETKAEPEYESPQLKKNREILAKLNAKPEERKQTPKQRKEQEEKALHEKLSSMPKEQKEKLAASHGIDPSTHHSDYNLHREMLSKPKLRDELNSHEAKPVSVPPPKESGEKQPHEMTTNDFWTSGAAGESRHGRDAADYRHKQTVQDALSDGKHVPKEVLSEYPELQKHDGDIPSIAKDAGIKSWEQAKKKGVDGLVKHSEDALKIASGSEVMREIATRSNPSTRDSLATELIKRTIQQTLITGNVEQGLKNATQHLADMTGHDGDSFPDHFIEERKGICRQFSIHKDKIIDAFRGEKSSTPESAKSRVELAKAKVEKAQPFVPEGVPGQQRGLFNEEPSGQKKLFDVIPQKGGKKPSATNEASLLEKIGDEQLDREEKHRPLTKQKGMMFEDYSRIELAKVRYARTAEHWITLKSRGDHGGVHVCINGEGKITKGPAALTGEHIGTLGDKTRKAEREARAAHAEASGEKLDPKKADQFTNAKHVAIHQAAKEASKSHGVDPVETMRLMPDAHEYLKQEHESRENAKKNARKITGLTAGHIADHENAYRDHSTVHNFDTSSRTVAEAHPELGFDPDDHETPSKVWELIREGKLDPPALHHPDVANLAAEWATASSKSDTTGHKDEADEWDRYSRIELAKARYKTANPDSSDEHWITIGGDEDGDKNHAGGTHVKITKDGRIVAGPEALAKKGIHKLSDFGKVNKTSHEETKESHENADNSGNAGTPQTGTESVGHSGDRPDGREQPGSDGSGSDHGGTGQEPKSERFDGPEVLTSRSEFTQKPAGSNLAEGIATHLSDDQTHGAELAIQSMDKTGGFLLADGTGIGKTREILAVANHYAKAGKKVLIVAPAEVLKHDWKTGTMAGSYASDGDLMGIKPKLVRGADGLAPGEVRMTTYGEIGDMKDHVDKNTVVLFDEAHGLKNSSSKQGKAGMDMAFNAHASLFATATPADKPEHLNYLMKAGVFHGMKKDVLFPQLGLTKTSFRNPHTGQEMHKWEISKKTGKAGFVRRLGVLFDSLTNKGQMIQRELSLEGVGIKSQTIPMSQEVHDEMERAANTIARESKGNAGLVKAQILGAQRRIQEPYKIPAAVDAVKDALANGRQAIVFVQRVNDSTVGKSEDASENITSGGTAGLLKKALEDAGIADIAEIHGGNKGKGKAEAAMKNFQAGSHRVVIATVESGGTGINLDDRTGDKPRTTIMMTPPLGATPYMQALGRSHRKTTRSRSSVVNLYGDTPVEEWNRQIIDSKLSSLRAITGSGQSVDPELANLSGEEIEAMAASGELGKTNPKDEKEEASLDQLRTTLGMRDMNRRDGGGPGQAFAAVHPDSKAAIHAALRSLADNDHDRAREINGVGFNKFDGQFGADLAGKDQLTDKQALAETRSESSSSPHQTHLDLVKSRADAKKPIKFRGNTFAHKDAIKNLGAKVGSFAKWDGDAKGWRMEPQYATDHDALAKGLHELATKGVETYAKRVELAKAKLCR